MEKTIPYEGKYIRVVREGTWEYVERTNGNDVAYIVPILKEAGLTFAWSSWRPGRRVY